MMQKPAIDSLLLRLITEVDLFRNLGRDNLATLLQTATSASFAPGEVVFEEGYDGHSMYVVVQGSFEVFRQVGGEHVEIAEIGPGEHFGEIALLASRPRTASVRSLDDSIALRFTKQAIFAEPSTAMYLFRNMASLMAERLVHANEEIILHKTGKHAPAPLESIGLQTGAIKAQRKG